MSIDTNWWWVIGASVLASMLFGRSKPKFIWILPALLTMVAAEAFSRTSLGSGFARNVIGIIGAFAASVVVFIAIVAVILGLIDKKLDKKDAVWLWLIPLLLIVTGTSGVLTGPTSTAYNAVYENAVSLFQAAV